LKPQRIFRLSRCDYPPSDPQPNTLPAPGSQSPLELYAAALRRFGPVPTLVEWDTNLAALEV
jgi:hypothetical protein